MKRNFNVIQINGFRGILMAIGIVVCLAAGFIGFPGMVMKMGWNIISQTTGLLPQIGIIQGVLLWGIVVVTYLVMKRNPFVVEFKSADNLSREEMDEVMQRIKVERQAELLTRAIANAKNLKDAENSSFIEKDENNSKDSQNIS